jgi:hypothetical protein
MASDKTVGRVFYPGGTSGGSGGETPEGAQAKANAARDDAITASLQKSANLTDLASVAAARTALALGNAALATIGTGAGNVAAGDDVRFADARTPLAHASSHGSGGSDPVTVAQSQVTGLATALAGKADLVGGVLSTAQVPSIAIVDYLGTVSGQTAMLALVGQKGDWAIRSDLGSVWVITGSNPTQLSSWTSLSYPTAPVTSVAGQTGAVTLAKTDVGLSNVDNTSDVNKPISTAQQTALDLKVPKGYNVYNVADFGAVGDGTTDDTTAIQTAINTVPTGSVLIGQQGKTYLTGALTIANKSRFTLQGLAITLKATGARIGILLSGTCDNIRILDNVIQGNGVEADAHCGVGIVTGAILTKILVKRNIIKDITLGVSLSADGAGSMQDGVIRDNIIDNISGTPAGYGYGIHTSVSSTTVPSNMRIINNRISRAQRHSIYVAKGMSIVVEGNVITDHRLGVANGGLYSAIILARSSDVVCKGNIVSRGYDTAITVGGIGSAVQSRNVVVTGNIFTTPQDSMPLMIIGQQDPPTDLYCTGALIADNTFYTENNGVFISVYSGKSIRVANNFMRSAYAGASVASAIRIIGQNETAGTKLYNDNLHFVGNTIDMVTGGTRFIFNIAGIETTAVTCTFEANRLTGAGQMFGTVANVSNPNFTILNQDTAGLTFAQGVGSTALSTKATTYVSVMDYGVKGDGITDDSVGIQAAIADAYAKGYTLRFPAKTFNFGTTLTIPGRLHIQGSGKERTILAYTGSGVGITTSTANTRQYDWSITDLTLSTSTGTIGLDADSVSYGFYRGVRVAGWSDAGVVIRSTVSGGAAANRFQNVNAESCATGFRLSATLSNSNVFFGCRALSCATRGWDIQDCGDNTLIGCQADTCGVGYYLNAAASTTTLWNRIRNCRVVSCTTGYQIASNNVQNTVVDAYYSDATTTTAISDSSTSSRRAVDLFAVSTPGSSVTLTSGYAFIAGGSVTLGGSSSVFNSAASTALYLRGNMSNTAGNTGVWIGNGTTLTDAGAYIVGFCQDTPPTHANPVVRIRTDGAYRFEASGILILQGSGTPEGVVTAPIGSLFLRSDGTAGAPAYFKESGTGNTGWVASGPRVNVQAFTAGGTWTKPAGFVTTDVACIAGGGGGGSGSVQANTNARGGGGGGGGGGMSFRTFLTSDLGATETVTVGAGGAGGGGVTANGSGAAGTAGGSTTFGTWLVARGGAAGAAGAIAATAAGGTGGGGIATGCTGGGGSSTGGAGTGGGTGNAGAGAGGGGGGLSNAATPVVAAGGAGVTPSTSSLAAGTAGAAGTGVAGTAGGAGTSAPANTGVVGNGGGGGGASDTAAGGSGGAGGLYGGGGGGGGAAVAGQTSGSGGNGAAGIVVAISR